ncbi:MAG: hypothetical protein ACREEK_12855 [Bradyrhizobium sp.]
MNRALVFLLLGPASVVLTTWVVTGMPTGAFVIDIAVMLFLITLPVSGIIGLVDGQLAKVFPILLRAPLMTMIGATTAFVLPAALLGPLPQDMSTPVALIGAFCTGMSSLFAHDYRHAKA